MISRSRGGAGAGAPGQRTGDPRRHVLHFVPSYALGPPRPGRRSAAGALRRVPLVTGEALPQPWPALVRALSARSPVVNPYGPTEAAVDVTPCGARPAALVPDRATHPNTRLYVLDAATRSLSLWVSRRALRRRASASVAATCRPRADRRALHPRSVREPGERGCTAPATWCACGADGELEFLGRIDHQVKCAASASSWARSRQRSQAPSRPRARGDRSGSRRRRQGAGGIRRRGPPARLGPQELNRAPQPT